MNAPAHHEWQRLQAASGLQRPASLPRPIAPLLTDVETIGDDASVIDKLRPLQPYMAQPGVLEVCVNRPGEVWVETYEGWTEYPCMALTFKHLAELATAVATFTGQHTTELHPLLSAALPSGERIQLVQPAATAPGTIVLAMRKPSRTVRRLTEFETQGLFDDVEVTAARLTKVEEELLQLRDSKRFGDFLRRAVQTRQNIVLAGATGSGKTTVMKALAEEIPTDERLITIEDAPELTLPNHRNAVHLLYSRGGQGASDVTAEDLLEACLRLRPDRIFQAEIRGAEAFSFLDLAASGHPGSMTSVHAGSCEEAFERIALMVRKSSAGGGMTMAEIARMAHSVIDVVVHTARCNGRFAVTGIHYDPMGRRGR